MTKNYKAKTATEADEECADGCKRGCWHDYHPKPTKPQPHTPGPWTAVGSFTVKAQDDIVASAGLPDEAFNPDGRTAERKANARLIAALKQLAVKSVQETE